MPQNSMENAPIPRWNGTERCPFCQSELADPGAGFVDHLEESSRCDAGFEQWREHIAGDIGGEWIG
ncbi:MAG: DUF7501 family protein [Halobacteriota archaeon]